MLRTRLTTRKGLGAGGGVGTTGSVAGWPATAPPAGTNAITHFALDAVPRGTLVGDAGGRVGDGDRAGAAINSGICCGCADTIAGACTAGGATTTE